MRGRKASAVKAPVAATLSNAAVETYIAAIAEPQRTALCQLREVIRAAVPAGAKEVISYGVPAFSLPKPFFGYAAFQHHLSVFPFSGSFFERFSDEIKSYSRTKSSLHLPFDKPLPVALIQRLVRARVADLTVKG
jgi:uncharacterized protein YdhG (YjbR/CyaY superfamily)